MTSKTKTTELTAAVEKVAFDPLNSALDHLIKYAEGYKPKLEGGTGDRSNATYGYVFADHPSDVVTWPCHSRMKSAYGKHMSTVWSVFCKPAEKLCSEEITKAYFDWITDKVSSPWRELFNLQPMIKHSKHDPLSKEFQWRYGFIFDNLKDIPANLLMNFFVATRMTKEWPITISRWYEITTKENLDPALVYFFMRCCFVVVEKGAATLEGTMWGQDKNKKTIGPYLAEEDRCLGLCKLNFYDWPLDTCSCDESYFHNFVRGNIVDKEGPVTEKDVSPSYQGINNIWGNRLLMIEDKTTYLNQLYTRYSPTLGSYRVVKSNLTGKAVEKESKDLWIFSYNELVSIMKQEEERLQNIVKEQSAQAA